jgi:hypothetical protein
MNLKESPRVNGYSNVLNGTDFPVQKRAAVKSEINTNNLIIVDKQFSGLCINCNLVTDCTWRENKKLFCEHYQ